MNKGDKFLIMHNRYRDENYLIFDHEKDGKLYFTIDVVDKMYRVIFNEDNTTIFAIDPSGGPFMHVGSKIPIEGLDSNIKEITNEFIVC